MAGVPVTTAAADHERRMPAPRPTITDFSSSLHSLDATDLDLNGRPPRVVLDTGVVLSALVFGGPMADRLRRAWRHGFCRPLVCHRTLMDLSHQLAAAPLGFPLAEQQQMLGEYLPYVLKVRVHEAVDGGERRNEIEPAGLVFVQLGLAGQAHVLVSSDAALLAMGNRLPFQVMALEPFLQLLRQSAIQPAPLRQTARRR
jgi:predicted nucleic acid-binding protein